MINSTMTAYYAKRAAEYEDIYLKPERQADLRVLGARLTEAFAGLNLLEIACGTGYWTQFAARSAGSIVATDYNEEVLRIARQKEYGDCPVTFIRSDAYVLDQVMGPFSGVLAGFWWSHIPKSKLGDFLGTLHSRLATGARVIIFDNRYVEGSNTPLSRTDAEGNTYQIRKLADGWTHEVLKNFPTRKELSDHIAPVSQSYEITELDYFWLAEYTTKGSA